MALGRVPARVLPAADVAEERALRLEAVVDRREARAAGRVRVVVGEVAGVDAAEALDRIAGMVDETTTATREISIATQQQRSASDQVVLAMGQVSDASRQYAVGSKQAAASAQELAALAEAMRGTIGRYFISRRNSGMGTS